MIPSVGVFAVALLSAALMGLAIQRGATCMVAAVDEMLTHRRAHRAAALAEAAVWVGGLAFLAAAGGWLRMTPAAYPVTPGTVAGGMLLELATTALKTAPPQMAGGGGVESREGGCGGLSRTC